MDCRWIQEIVTGVGFVLILLSLVWWMIMVLSLPHLDNEYLQKYTFSCLYSGDDDCVDFWNFAKVSLPTYTPAFLWMGTALLTIATALRLSQKTTID